MYGISHAGLTSGARGVVGCDSDWARCFLKMGQSYQLPRVNVLTMSQQDVAVARGGGYMAGAPGPPTLGLSGCVMGLQWCVQGSAVLGVL